MTPLERGLVQVYTGNGKGKTSAALGTVLRAVGHGLAVFIVFFMKGDPRYGEQKALALLPRVAFERTGRLRHVDRHNVTEEDRAEVRKAMEAARRAMLSGEYDIIILDEVNVALSWGLVGLEEVEKLIAEKPPQVELILTGRYAPPELLELADLVTEMAEVKHPYTKGVLARRGLDY
jgi:cob(I)alamin adenosyltransferase